MPRDSCESQAATVGAILATVAALLLLGVVLIFVALSSRHS